jgi:hypothetical protein
MQDQLPPIAQPALSLNISTQNQIQPPQLAPQAETFHQQQLLETQSLHQSSVNDASSFPINRQFTNSNQLSNFDLGYQEP